MPGKRKRSSGVRDVNPQFMSFSVVQTGNDAATGGSIQPPVSLAASGDNIVMEIFRIWFQNTNPAGTPSNGVQLTLSSKNFGTTTPTLGRY